MRRRRGTLDPFLRTAQARWLVVSVVGREAVFVRRLEPGADLQSAFFEAVEDHRTQGWFIENEPSYPCVFARRGGERRMLALLHIDPAGSPQAHFSPWRE
jgi:hypothetical protein